MPKRTELPNLPTSKVFPLIWILIKFAGAYLRESGNQKDSLEAFVPLLTHLKKMRPILNDVLLADLKSRDAMWESKEAYDRYLKPLIMGYKKATLEKWSPERLENFLKETELSKLPPADLRKLVKRVPIRVKGQARLPTIRKEAISALQNTLNLNNFDVVQKNKNKSTIKSPFDDGITRFRSDSEDLIELARSSLLLSNDELSALKNALNVNEKLGRGWDLDSMYTVLDLSEN